jgi:hypothetical protein
MNRIAKLFQRWDERRGGATPGTTSATSSTATASGPVATAQLAAPGASGA